MSTPMDYRSTNAEGRYVHFGGELIAGSESGRGIALVPASTSGSPSIIAVGDDANVGLRIVAKGTGVLQFGDSSNTIQLGSTAGGAQAFKGAFSTNSTISWAGIVMGHGTEFTFASTTVDVNPGDLFSVGLIVATANLSSQTSIAWWRLSTTATSRVTVMLQNDGSTAGSTGSGTLQMAWMDLT